MPGGLIRGLAKAFVDEYSRVKAEQRAREAGAQQTHYQSPPPYPPRPQQQQNGVVYDEPAYSPKYAAAKTVEVPASPPAQSQQTPKGNAAAGCKPYAEIVGGRCYSAPMIPEVDVCPTCFNALVVNTPFAPIFHEITIPAGLPHTCDLAFLAIRQSWLEICSRAGMDPSPQGLQSSLGRFGKAAATVNDELSQLATQYDALEKEVEMLKVQRQYQQSSAMNQISFNMALRSSAAIGGNVLHSNHGSSVGHAGLAQAGQIGIVIQQKLAQMRQLQIRFKALTGGE